MQDTTAILTRLGIPSLNEMQLAAIDACREQGDVVLLSPTGSGKTLAFLLPVIELLHTGKAQPQALILVPSRELALQIEAVFKASGTSFKIVACYGGHSREIEENSLVEVPVVIVGTPGRVADHLRRRNFKAGAVEMLVLDEFDKSLELGFADEMAFILGALPNVRKKILTSATDAAELPDFLKLQEPQRLDFLLLSGAGRLEIKIALSPVNDKADTLFRLLCSLPEGKAVVFCNHRDAVERTAGILEDKGLYPVAYHGGMEQYDRECALSKFRNGTAQVLVTTDLGSRGLDIAGVLYIIHYHLPHTVEAFIHRNGRTARMDAGGTAIMILAPDETMPDYVSPDAEQVELPLKPVIPHSPEWQTFYIAAGKKDKVNKTDIVGFLIHKGKLDMADIGLVEVKDFVAYVAVRRSKAAAALHLLKTEKIKNRKARVGIA